VLLGYSLGMSQVALQIGRALIQLAQNEGL
jgi:hypothetical protein